ncbi:hypothetical protein BYT27DRAFT_7185147 [Phlegmacium glaucopus]|nr:hypothetical protein BYT27DRAFT_7185147 [Phlegmacium glaucopus]
MESAVYSQDIKNVFNLMADDLVVAFMGPTGSGKSNLIDTLTNQPGRRSGSSLASCTQKIQAVRMYDHPKYANRLVLVDTPGFDDAEKSDMEILQMIGDWLKQTYKKNIKLAGIVYLHKITDNRMAGAPHRNLRMFSELCGDQAVKKVILVTTMWDKLAKKSVGAQREHNLRIKYWRVMMENGALVARFRNTPQTAWKIIDMIIQEPSAEALLLQEELVDFKLRLNETKAGMMLYSNLEELLVEQQKTIGLLAEQARAQNDPAIVAILTAEYDRTEKNFHKTFSEMKRLRIPMGRRIILFFSKKSREVTRSLGFF